MKNGSENWRGQTKNETGSLNSRQRGRMVNVSDSQSGGPGFKSRSGPYPDLFLGSPEFKSSATLVNSQLVCLRPAGILNNVMFNLNYLFQLFARPPPLATVL